MSRAKKHNPEYIPIYGSLLPLLKLKAIRLIKCTSCLQMCFIWFYYFKPDYKLGWWSHSTSLKLNLYCFTCDWSNKAELLILLSFCGFSQMLHMCSYHIWQSYISLKTILDLLAQNIGHFPIAYRTFWQLFYFLPTWSTMLWNRNLRIILKTNRQKNNYF